MGCPLHMHMHAHTCTHSHTHTHKSNVNSVTSKQEKMDTKYYIIYNHCFSITEYSTKTRRNVTIKE